VPDPCGPGRRPTNRGYRMFMAIATSRRLRDSGRALGAKHKLLVAFCSVERLQQIAFDLLHTRAVGAVRMAT